MSFAGQTIAITGGSSGLGLQLARNFAQQGARLALMARDADRLDSAARECGGDVFTFVGDVTKEEDCRAFIQQVVGERGGLDHLIANAGQSMWARFEEVEDLSLYRRLLEVNYLGAVYCTHAALSALKQSRGQVVVISSIQAKVGVPLHTGYGASKHALEGFIDALRYELDGTGVNLLKIYPHWIRGTELRRHALGPDAQPMGKRKRSHSDSGVDVDKCAGAIMNAMARRRQTLYVPWTLRYVQFIKNLFPGFVRWSIRRKVGDQK
ncbi:MAG: short chain dehydrogenase [Verrucomicrobiales bacterium]|nr:short chain dehydrogenase [Verrucomicrobiales bacterium]